MIGIPDNSEISSEGEEGGNPSPTSSLTQSTEHFQHLNVTHFGKILPLPVSVWAIVILACIRAVTTLCDAR